MKMILQLAKILLAAYGFVCVMGLEIAITPEKEIDCKWPDRHERNAKIIGGRSIPIETMPYQVGIQTYNISKWETLCGGTILSPDYVLTAAHCGEYFLKKNCTFIFAGTSSRISGGSIHHLDRIILHPSYGQVFSADGEKTVKSIAGNDIAIIKVREPFVFDGTRQPVKLYHQNEALPVGAIVNVSGWGSEHPVEKIPSIMLKQVEIEVLDRAKCLKSPYKLPADSFCAGFQNGGKDACRGDSGSPVTLNDRQLGIVSFGLNITCALINTPAAYVEVALFRDWIKNVTGV